MNSGSGLARVLLQTVALTGLLPDLWNGNLCKGMPASEEGYEV